MTLKNATTLPRVFYGLHMVEGVAEYREPKREPYRIMIAEEAIKNMDATFSGKPVYVQHVDNVNLDSLQEEADGYVIESFFNKSDGKHWAKFIVVSDKGHQAIRNGWKLSNAYIPKDFSDGGLWHGVEYSKEITRGEYEHLAIVPNPRYEESVILTPEEFKAYNLEKEIELTKIANAKGETSMLSFFKKQKVENSTDLAGMSVILPKSKKEVTVEQLVNDMDAIHNMHGYAAPEHMVKIGNEEMSVKDLSNKYSECLNELEDMKKKKDNEGKEDMPEQDEKKNEDKPVDEEKKNEEKPAEEVKKEKMNEDKEPKEDDEKKKNAHFEALKNAPDSVIHDIPPFELPGASVARGVSRYGSGN